MKKRFLLVAVVSALVAALALVGCSSSNSSNQSSNQGSSNSNAAATEEVTLVTPGTITILTDVPYPPYEYYDSEGKVVGLDIDIMRAVADKLGYTVEVKPMDFDGIIAALVAGGQGDMGAAAITVTPERAESVDFTTAYFVDDQAFAVMDNSNITEENAREELSQPGVTIAVQAGTSSEAYAKENYPQATIMPYKQVSDAFAAMQAGQADVVCCNLGVVQNMLSGAYSDARVVLEVATGEEYAFAVSKDNPELTKKVNEALAELQKDGTLDQIIANYQSKAYDEEGEI